MLRHAVILVALVLLLIQLGCTDEPTGSDASTLVEGSVLKDGAPLKDAIVDLYDDENYTLIDSVFTDASGAFAFEDVPYGRLQLKRSSIISGEFGYVRYIFTLDADTPVVTAPTMDVSTYGLAHISPADGDSVVTPDVFNPLTFLWYSFQGDIEYNSARLYNHQDSLIWSSAEESETTASFNGIMNQGGFSGDQVSPGLFRWRVKVKFPNQTKAATVKTEVVLR